MTPALAVTASTLYVDDTSPACTDSGAGTQPAPFCTIQAAANVVQPGQTVVIGGSRQGYDEDVTVTTSGTPAAPITFEAANTYFYVGGQTHAFTVTGASNIVISGLHTYTSQDSVLVSGSSNVRIENSSLGQWSGGSGTGIAGVHVTAASSSVTIERSRVTNSGLYGVLIDSGSTGTVVATNYFENFGKIGVSVAGASGTDVVGNTLVDENTDSCDQGIAITGASSSSVVENNVVTGMSPTFGSTCAAGAAIDLLVSADSAATTTEQYNVLSAEATTTQYEWAGTAYTTVGAFQSATGKGVQDTNGVEPADLSTASLPSSLPLIDSADANAPGETTTDIYGNPRVDDASVANAGTGVGYVDRGAIEYQEYTSSNLNLSLQSAQHVDADVSLQGIPWGFVGETFDWGDGTKTQFSGTTTDTGVDFTSRFRADHVYASRGSYTITETLTDAAGTRTLTGKISTAGSTYTPVTPTRVLDTRHGIGTGGATNPVPTDGAVAFSVTDGVTGAPLAGTITAVVLNVTVTAPSSGGYITAYPDGTSRPKASNLNFSAGETVPNLVTVKVGTDGKVALYNGSAGTAHLIADVAGYYSADASGSGFLPVGPARLLDTRKGIGTGGSTQPVSASGALNLKVEGAAPVPATGVSAVVLNVTVTAPTAGGYITVYPGGTNRPTSSNLNFSPGETVPNLVTVPVGADGTVNLFNGSGGTAHLIADVAGYYTKTGGHAFVPIAPTRIFDTRTGLGEDSPAHRIPAFSGQFDDIGGGELFDGSVFVLNVTVTGPAAGGYLTVYSSGSTLPAVSNLNFSPAQTVPNLVITSVGNNRMPVFYNGSAGSTDVVADAFGYFS